MYELVKIRKKKSALIALLRLLVTNYYSFDYITLIAWNTYEDFYNHFELEVPLYVHLRLSMYSILWKI